MPDGKPMTRTAGVRQSRVVGMAMAVSTLVGATATAGRCWHRRTRGVAAGRQDERGHYSERECREGSNHCYHPSLHRPIFLLYPRWRRYLGLLYE